MILSFNLSQPLIPLNHPQNVYTIQIHTQNVYTIHTQNMYTIPYVLYAYLPIMVCISAWALENPKGREEAGLVW